MDSRQSRRARYALYGSAGILLIAVLVAALGRGGQTPLPRPGIGQAAGSGDPFAYLASREARFVLRATAGSSHVLFVKSPGGVLATAARVASFQRQIDTATAGTGVDPSIVEAIVFLESAGRPDVIAGSDPSAAAGLTQILAQTGQSLLGMHIDLAASRKLTVAIDNAYAAGRNGLGARLEAQRAKIDDRFDPRKALAATVRYLSLARGHFGRPDLAVVSYHMGIGNLQNLLADYDGGRPVPYAQLYFDTAPNRRPAAFSLLQGFGDDSSLYYWRVLGAAQIMRLYRSDRGALAHLTALQTATDSGEEVLHPPAQTRMFADPGALASAYLDRTIVPLPSNSAALGLAYDPLMGTLAGRLGVPVALYRGLRGAALDLLVELAGRVRALSGVAALLIVTSTVTDARYQSLLGISDPVASSGYSFEIARRYTSRAQAAAFQAVLDRLEALDLIAWVRGPRVIHVAVAGDAGQVISGGV